MFDFWLNVYLNKSLFHENKKNHEMADSETWKLQCEFRCNLSFDWASLMTVNINWYAINAANPNTITLHMSEIECIGVW